MKKRLPDFLIITFLCNLVFMQNLIADNEPNDFCRTAEIISVNINYTCHLGQKTGNVVDNTDWYKVDLPSDGSLTVFERVSGDLISSLWLFDENDTINAYDFHYGVTNGTDSVAHKFLKAGRYYIKSYNWTNTPGGTYNLLLSFTPALFVNDSGTNDNCNQSQSLSFSNHISGHLGYVKNRTADMEDWYYVDMPTDGKLQIIEEPAVELLSGIFLFEGDGTKWITTRYGRKGVADTLNFNNLKAGRYYIRVYNWDNHYGSYRLIVFHSPVSLNNDKENNNNPNSAMPMTLSTEYTGHLGYYKNDTTDTQDWYVFNLTKDGTVKIEETTYENLYTNIMVLDNNGTTWLGGSPSHLNSTDTISLALKAGKYYINIFNNQFGYGSYKVSAKYLAKTSITENIFNNSYSIYPNPASDYLILEFNSYAFCDNISVYNTSGVKLLESDFIQKSNRINVSCLPKGVYLLQLRSRDAVFATRFIKN